MKSKRKIVISTIITIILIISIILIGRRDPFIILIFFIGIFVCFIIYYISKKSFGGITGDAMGATNEIVRIACMILLI